MSIHPTAIVHPARGSPRNVESAPIRSSATRRDRRRHLDRTPRGHRTPPASASDNRIFQFCSIGEEPRTKYAAEPTRLEIGDRNTIREFCTFNTGTAGCGLTRVGNDNWIMAYVHVRTTAWSATRPSSPTTRAGRPCPSWATGRSSAVSPACIQFVRVGAHSFCGSAPCCCRTCRLRLVPATRQAHGINSEGLKRRVYSSEGIGHQARPTNPVPQRPDPRRRPSARQIAAERPTVGARAAAVLDFIADSGRGIVR